MNQFTPEGQQLIKKIANRYNFSPDAVLSMLHSVIRSLAPYRSPHRFEP
jgi:hypothetical protein